MAFIDSSVVNVALPKMESDLATTLSAMTWVINAYTLCMSALLLVGGAAADQIGKWETPGASQKTTGLPDVLSRMSGAAGSDESVRPEASRIY